MKKTIFALLAPGLMALVGSPLYAAPVTELSIFVDATHFVNIDENGVVSGAGFTTISSSGTGAHGQIQWTGSVGNFTLSTDSGQGFGILPSPQLGNVQATNIASSAGGDITISFTDTGYTGLLGGFALNASLNSLVGNGTATFREFGSATNAIPGNVSIGPNPLLVTTALGAQAFNEANPIGSSGSLTEQIEVAFAGGGSANAGLSIANVPEPASFVFLGSALIGIAGLFRKKRQA